MRSEKEMMDLIIDTATNDERIRAVIMSGSRANPNARKDIFQDYDIVYIVRDIDSFISDHRWVDRFGERIMMQMPEDKILPPALNDGRFVYLMKFKDGNRLDLTLIPVEKMGAIYKPDSLSVLLLDKDGIIGSLPPSNDSDYHIQRPSEKAFVDTCNEFWWICMDIGKGLRRKELPYIMFLYEQINRKVLLRMMEWYVGVKTGFSVSAGKFGKYFQDYLEKDEWDAFVATYTNADFKNIWQSLFKMCELFRYFAVHVADHLDFEYPYNDDQNVMGYLRHIKDLPADSD
ncbi:MAG: aminoglycoside 6-adenylyltransferase [Bacillaceae bacterium]|nr:aminoglycoside 6-adenylyltransferase [Bacillaceae bacterium]